MIKKIQIPKNNGRTNKKKQKVLEKKNSRQRHTIGLTEFFDSLEIKNSKTQKNLSFCRCLKKSLWNHLKKSGTGTNRCALKNQYRRWGKGLLDVGRMTIPLKHSETSKRNSIFEGADFRKLLFLKI